MMDDEFFFKMIKILYRDQKIWHENKIKKISKNDVKRDKFIQWSTKKFDSKLKVQFTIDSAILTNTKKFIRFLMYLF